MIARFFATFFSTLNEADSPPPVQGYQGDKFYPLYRALLSPCGITFILQKLNSAVETPLFQNPLLRTKL